jgi:hypothetical protein
MDMQLKCAQHRVLRNQNIGEIVLLHRFFLPRLTQKKDVIFHFLQNDILPHITIQLMGMNGTAFKRVTAS